MTSAERVGIWFLMAALVGMAFIWWAALNKRIDEATPALRAPVTTASPSTTTTTPLAAEVAGLRRVVLELQANRGLSGPEVRELVETLLPAPSNPPTDEGRSTTVPTARVSPVPRLSSPSVAPTTTEKKRRRPR